MSPEIIIDALILTACLAIGVPVPLCFAAAALFLVVTGDIGSSKFLISAGFSKLSSIILIAIPLYILAGGLMTHGGIAARLVDLAESIVGRLRGGLGVVVIVSTAVFGAISGMASSAVAAIGSIMIPRMVERGYDRGYAAALVSCSAVLALLIPPSASMILYGWVTSTSIAAVFLAPILPGFLLMVLFAFWNVVLTRKMPVFKPPPMTLKEGTCEVYRMGKRSILGLMMPILILGCIYGGVTTPTEAAAIAVFYSLPLGFLIYKDLNWRSLYDILWRTGQISGVLIVLVFFSSMMVRLYTMEDVPQGIMESLLGATDNRIVLLLLINLFLLLVGMFMDDVSGILLASPMLLPVVLELGVHPVHFGAIVGVNLGMGLITPPTAPILYFGGLIGETTFPKMLKPALVFVFLGYFPVVLLTTFIPELSMFLPRLLLGIE